MQKPKQKEGDVRIVDMGYASGSLCQWCGYSSVNVEAETCDQCSTPLDSDFYEEVFGFADLFRKEG